MTSTGSVFISGAAALAVAASAQAVELVRFDEAGRYVNSLASLAKGRFAQADVDGDGISDLVLDGVSGISSRYLLVVGRTGDGSIRIKQTLRVADEFYPLNRVLTFSMDGQSRVLTVAESGVCHVYAGWPLEEIDRFDVPPNVSSAAAGDIDGDGVPDLLVTSLSTLGFYTVDGQLRDTLQFLQPTDIALAQLDADPALEIVLNTGTILDGATHATEWQYSEIFGFQVATGKVVPDGSTGWVGTGPANHFTVFRAAPWSPLWSVPLPQWGNALAALPIDDSGRDGAAVFSTSASGVEVHDLHLNQLRYRIHVGTRNVLALTGLDVDGDALPDLAVGTDGVAYPNGALTIHDARDGATKWEFVSTDGSHQAMVWGDADRDGKEELTVIGTDNNTQWLTIAYDADSGLPLWRAPIPASLDLPAVPLFGRSIELAVDSDTGDRRIVLAGGDSQNAQITVLDGRTRDILLALQGSSIEELRTRTIKGLIVSDVDADGVEDVIVTTEPSNFTSEGTQILIFSGHDGALLRRTDLPATTVQDALLVHGDAGGPNPDRIIVSTPTQLLAYDLQTGASAWSLDVEHRHVVSVRRGLAGAEIVTISQTGEIRVFDATTRQPLRQFSLGRPVRQARVLDDDVHSILLALERRLIVLDGGTGAVRASSDGIGLVPPDTRSLAVSPEGAGTWRAAISTTDGIFRFRVRLTDVLFEGTFDPD